MNLLKLAMVAALAYSCSSAKTENRKIDDVKHDSIQRDYKVIDASMDVRPGWTQDAEVWARQNEKDLDKVRFFSYETEPQISRDMACDLAKAKARTDIASEISTFISKKLGFSQEGKSSAGAGDAQLREFIENTLAEKISALINGAEIAKTYWEKRKYEVSLGASKDYQSFTCATLIRMDAKALKDAVRRASEIVEEKATDPATKENVKKALEKVDVEFDNAKHGKI